MNVNFVTARDRILPPTTIFQENLCLKISKFRSIQISNEITKQKPFHLCKREGTNATFSISNYNLIISY